jgi:hypothetical protein
MRNAKRLKDGTAWLLAGCLLALAGCEGGGNEPAAVPIAPEPEKPKEVSMPESIPGLDEARLEKEDERPGSMEVMVRERYDRGEKETYTHDPKHPVGTIKGGCRIVKKKGMTFPPEDKIEPTGENAIKDPEPKEVEYYTTIGLRRRNMVSRLGRAKYGYSYAPYNVVLRLRDIRIGRRPPLTRPVMMVRRGRIRAGDDSNYGGSNVQFAPVHERAQFTTWDSHPSEIVVTRSETGEEVFRKTVRYLQREEYKDEDHTTGQLAYEPQFITTPILRHPGRYVVTDARHPWIRGHLFVVENPYVTVTTYHKYYPRCNFEISGVPPGKHTLEVWHPLYEPVERTVEVEVEANKVTELLIKFRPRE